MFSPCLRGYSQYFGFLPHSKDELIRLIGDSKLPVGVNVNGVCLYMSAL